MSGVPRESTGSASVDVPPEGLRGAKARAGRRIVRGLVWAGLALLVVGLAIALLAGGPSVAATVTLSAGLLVEAAGLVAYRVLFWASVYAKDRPKTARRIGKSGP